MQALKHILNSMSEEERKSFTTLLALYDNERSSFYETHCAVCDKKLQGEDFILLKPEHFNRTCKEHTSYATAFDLRTYRVKLGLKERLSFEDFLKQ
jgi:CRISPR/Cas system-associated protein Cas10 (large subunit of type III CRISPR-Cas system)